MLAKLLAVAVIFFAKLVVTQEYGVEDETSWALSHNSIGTDEPFFWGPYVPGTYFGLRPRISEALSVHLLWANADDPSKIAKNLRYQCAEDSGIANYGWTAYNIRTGGTHIVNDTQNKIDLIIDYVKLRIDSSHHSWGLKLHAVPRSDAKDGQLTTVALHIATDQLPSGKNSEINCIKPIDSKLAGRVECRGANPSIGQFRLDLRSQSHGHPRQRIHAVTDQTTRESKSLFIDLLNEADGTTGLIPSSPKPAPAQFIQLTGSNLVEFDVVFAPGEPGSWSSDLDDEFAGLSKAIDNSTADFRTTQEKSFAAQKPFTHSEHLRLLQSLSSNLIGSIAYFFEDSEVNKPQELFSALPTRSSLPKGFDEGFHLQVIQECDLDLALDILRSWLDRMGEADGNTGEQVLGSESVKRDNPAFTAHAEHADLPTFFLVIESFLKKLEGQIPYSGSSSQHLQDKDLGRAYVQTIYPKLRKHYSRFRQAHAGSLEPYQKTHPTLKEGYCWNGQTDQGISSSGLVDYPRPPSSKTVLHVDALSWVGLMSSVLEKVSSYLGEHKDTMEFAAQRKDITSSIDAQWSEDEQVYCDLTVTEQGPQHVCHRGYISLLPFLAGLLEPGHPRLSKVLSIIRDPSELGSRYGVRSLSKKDRYYGKDQNRWRGTVWVNINFMILCRLLELSRSTGPMQKEAVKMYTELRLNIVDTVFRSWKEVGVTWEYYDSATGKGQGAHQFTGSTALVARIMAMPDIGSMEASHSGEPMLPDSSQLLHSTELGIHHSRLAVAAGTLIILSILLRGRLRRFLRRLVS